MDLRVCSQGVMRCHSHVQQTPLERSSALQCAQSVHHVQCTVCTLFFGGLSCSS